MALVNRHSAVGLRIAVLALLNVGLMGASTLVGDDRWSAIFATFCLLNCNWVLLQAAGLGALAPAVVYLNVLAVFHLGLVVPLALGVAVGTLPSWLRTADLGPALLLLMLAITSFTVGGVLARGSARLRWQPGLGEEWSNHTLYKVGLWTAAAGCCALVLGIRDLGFARFIESTHFETYRLARTYDPRLFVTSLQLTPMGFYLALAAAPRHQLGRVAIAGVVWAGMIFVLGYRGFALTPVAAAAVILAKRRYRLPTWMLATGLCAVLVAIPVARQLRNTRLVERSSMVTQLRVAPLEAIQEIGGSLRPLVHTIDLMENESFRWGSTYFQAMGQVVPSLSLKWRGDPYLPLEQLPPSHWVSRLASPWNYRNYGGLGFSAVAEPYMNFGIAGVVGVFALLGFVLVRLEVTGSLRPTQLACWGMLLGPLLWATRNSSGVFFRPAIWGVLLVLAARVAADSMARTRVKNRAVLAPQRIQKI